MSFGLTGLLSTFYGIAALVVFFLCVYMYAVIGSAISAHNNREYQLQPWNRWYYYLAVSVFTIIIFNLLFLYRGTILGYETYRVPTSSMEPALQPGDFITVDTRDKKPVTGEVIVFLNPEDNTTPYVKRVVATGNDRIAIEQGKVMVNGQAQESPAVLLDKRQRVFSVTMREIQVPEDYFFVLGDWRDNSKDSRHFGTVPVANVIGRVTYIWFSSDIARVGKKVN